MNIIFLIYYSQQTSCSPTPIRFLLIYMHICSHSFLSILHSQFLEMGVFIVAAIFFMQIYITGAKVPAVIVFGDSSVDAGNNNQLQTVLKSNFRPYGRDFFGGKATGRFSNGRVPPDFISESYGLRPYVPAYLDPAYNISDFATGVCFASAGTGYDNATSDVLVSLSLSLSQIALSFDEEIAIISFDQSNSIMKKSRLFHLIKNNSMKKSYDCTEYELFVSCRIHHSCLFLEVS